MGRQTSFQNGGGVHDEAFLLVTGYVSQRLEGVKRQTSFKRQKNHVEFPGKERERGDLLNGLKKLLKSQMLMGLRSDRSPLKLKEETYSMTPFLYGSRTTVQVLTFPLYLFLFCDYKVIY